MRFILLLLLLMGGCSSTTYKLGTEWAPLEQIVEGDLPFVSDTAVTTIGKNLYTVDLDELLKETPPGSVEFHALMLHEQEHSKRQIATGVTPWIFNYLINDEFKWEEEKAGWGLQIKYLKSVGRAKSPEHYARVLSSSGYGNMVSYEEALAWAKSL